MVKKYLAISGTTQQRLAKMAKLLGNSDAANEGIGNLTQVFALLEASGLTTDKVVFDPTIARGLDYYTGIIYETNLKGAPELGSVCSGGRYDNLVEDLGGPSRPAVGTSIGVDRLYDGLLKLGLLREAKTPTQVLVTNFGIDYAPDYFRIASELRAAGVPTEIFYEAVKLGKQLTFANRQGIPQVVIMGPSEVQRGVAKVRSMSTGVEAEVPIDSLVEMLVSAQAPNEQ